MIALFCLILGLLIGYYADRLYTMVKALYLEAKEAREAKQIGVVRPTGIRATKNQPFDLSKNAGLVRRPSQDEIALARIKERDRILQENHQ